MLGGGAGLAVGWDIGRPGAGYDLGYRATWGGYLGLPRLPWWVDAASDAMRGCPRASALSPQRLGNWVTGQPSP